MSASANHRIDRALVARLFDPALDVAVDGRDAQRHMEPVRRGSLPRGTTAADPHRDAAALAYLFERDGRILLPLTVRHHDLTEHRGQVSLPGGRPEPGESHWDTALREAREEVDLDVADLDRLGVLAPVDIVVTHTFLHVCVAWGPDPGPLTANPTEVERIVLVRLDDLVDPACRREKTRVIDGVEVAVPYFDVEGLFLWGATAMALAELVARIRILRS